MSTENNGAPVPPAGVRTEQPVGSGTGDTRPLGTESSAEKKAKKDKKTKRKKEGSQGGGFAKSIAGGAIGAVIVVALVMGLWAGTPLFDGLKSSGGSNSGTITINGDTEATTAEAVAAKDLSSVVTIYVYSENSSWNQYFSSGSSGRIKRRALQPMWGTFSAGHPCPRASPSAANPSRSSARGRTLPLM